MNNRKTISIVLGGQKCGTSSIHDILQQLYNTSVAPKETPLITVHNSYNWYVFATKLYNIDDLSSFLTFAEQNNIILKFHVVLRKPSERFNSALRNEVVSGRDSETNISSNNNLIREIYNYSNYKIHIDRLEDLINGIVDISVNYYNFRDLFFKKDKISWSSLLDCNILDLRNICIKKENVSRFPRFFFLDRIFTKSARLIEHKYPWIYRQIKNTNTHKFLREINSHSKNKIEIDVDSLSDKSWSNKLNYLDKYYENFQKFINSGTRV